MINMGQFADIVSEYFIPRNVFEIGSRDAKHAERLRSRFGISKDSTYIFEAHPQLFKNITIEFPAFKAINAAVGNECGTATFYARDLEQGTNQGTSSTRKRENMSAVEVGKYRDEQGRLYRKITVPAITMNAFITQNGIESLDLVKIDVEGATYDVLRGFGHSIRHVKAMHIEGELKPVWAGETLFPTIERYLRHHGFTKLTHEQEGSQVDSIWMRRSLLLRRRLANFLRRTFPGRTRGSH